MTTVAGDYGYRDGSGVHRVVQRLEKKAEDEQALARRLKALAKEVSRVDPTPSSWVRIHVAPAWSSQKGQKKS